MMVLETEGRLARAQVRVARRVAARILDGDLVVVVGKSAQRRRDFEAVLVGVGVGVASAELELDGDPWAQIIALASDSGTPSVSWPEAGSDSFVSTLNLGRERFGELSRGVLLWIGGLDALESFPLRAPDLWAYRGGLEWVVAVDDFDPGVREGALAPTPLAQQIEEVQGLLAQLQRGDPRRISKLATLGCNNVMLGDHASALANLAEAEQLWASLSNADGWSTTGSLLRRARLLVARELGRISEVIELGESGVDRELGAALTARGCYERAAQLYTSMLAEIPPNSNDGDLRRGPIAGGQAHIAAALGHAQAARALARAAIAAGDGAAKTSRGWREPVLLGASALSKVEDAALRPVESLRHALVKLVLTADHIDESHAWGESLRPVVARLAGLGLDVDILRLLETAINSGSLNKRRALVIWTLRARTFLTRSTLRFGLWHLRVVHAGYQRELAQASPTELAPMSIGAVELITDDLIPLSSTAAEAGELRRLGLELARTGERSAIEQRQHDWACDLRSAAAALLGDLERHDEARELLDQNLSWSRASEGPGRVCERLLALARAEARRGELRRALVEVDRARRALEQAPSAYRSQLTSSELLLTHASILVSAGQSKRAREAQIQARRQMASAGLHKKELEALHALAEAIPGENASALDQRERAAADALALVAPSGLIYEEARALANFALVHAERGRRAPAETMLEQARWLSAELVHGETRDYIDHTTAAIAAVLS